MSTRRASAPPACTVPTRERHPSDGLDQVARAAIDWRVRIDSGGASEEDRAALACWLAADSAHKAAWERIGGLLAEPVARIRRLESQQEGCATASLQALLSAPVSRRKVLSRTVASLAVLAGTTWIVDRQLPLVNLTADFSTSTGERRTVLLSDGSVLTLDARSAADVEFSPTHRALRLHSGRIAVQVASDPLARPFAVDTARGIIRTANARLSVQDVRGHACVAVLENDALFIAKDGLTQSVRAGETLSFGTEGAGWRGSDALVQAAWLDGVLDVRDEPLGSVVEALRPYQGGIIRITPAAARLRVFGVLRLDEPDRALSSLADALPIVVSRLGPWLTLIREA
jgi:transmembrane sensor